ncbi:hypothetical protein DENIS_2403 [Desulfonema ishimotonii]|uniref:Uncharacterized protein n=1 Tax=Desulfonema ishimotonii TaxID=45657 RepID=A0A401FWX4_9BACT|nr:hypothetical protein DENIS_2403 [Desulfonema ishimotonii]
MILRKTIGSMPETPLSGAFSFDKETKYINLLKRRVIQLAHLMPSPDSIRFYLIPKNHETASPSFCQLQDCSGTERK